MGNYFAMPEQTEVTPEMKRAALVNALMQAGQAMVKPTVGTSGFHQLLNAIPGAIGAGYGGYSQSLSDVEEMRGKQAKTKASEGYASYSQAEANRLKQTHEEYKKMQEQLTMPAPGAEIPGETLADTFARQQGMEGFGGMVTPKVIGAGLEAKGTRTASQKEAARIYEKAQRGEPLRPWETKLAYQYMPPDIKRSISNFMPFKDPSSHETQWSMLDLNSGEIIKNTPMPSQHGKSSRPAMSYENSYVSNMTKRFPTKDANARNRITGEPLNVNSDVWDTFDRDKNMLETMGYDVGNVEIQLRTIYGERPSKQPSPSPGRGGRKIPKEEIEILE